MQINGFTILFIFFYATKSNVFGSKEKRIAGWSLSSSGTATMRNPVSSVPESNYFLGKA